MMNTNRKIKKLSNSLKIGLLSLSLLKVGLSADEIPPVVTTTYNYTLDNYSNDLNATSSYIHLFGLGGFARSTNNPYLTDTEEEDLQRLICNIRENKTDSYSDFLNISSSFSEDKKTVLLSLIGDILYFQGHNTEYSGNSQQSNELFGTLQLFLQNPQNKYSKGRCNHFASSLESISNDLGIPTAAVTGIKNQRHAFNVLNFEKEARIIDGEMILTANTKNIEKILELYQRENGNLTFEHSFFEDSKFEYRLITQDGKNFLNFIDYDESLNSLKKNLISSKENISNYFDESPPFFKINCQDFFGKIGKFQSTSFSPTDEILLFQGGYKNEFTFRKIKLIPTVSFVVGDNELSGEVLDLTINTFNKMGFNAYSRLTGNSFTASSRLFDDASANVGISYLFSHKENNIEPYLFLQSSLQVKDFDTEKEGFGFGELKTGVNVSFLLGKDIYFYLNPDYSKKLWEDSFDTSFGIRTKFVKLNFGGSLSKPSYKFCPDKVELKVNVSTFYKVLEVRAGYKYKRDDYGGEINNYSSFTLGGVLYLN